MEGSPRRAEEAETEDGGPSDLEELLDVLDDAADGEDEVSVDLILEAVGRRSFGALLLVAGLVAISPIGDIPGGPSLMALMILLVAVQLLVGRDEFWLPGWLERRKLSGGTFRKAIGWLRKPARFIDRFLRPRLQFMTHSKGAHGVAMATTLIALAMVPMELVPFSITGAALTIILFGLALIAHDGLMALIAFGIFAATGVFLVYQLV